ncbi:LiaF transmembrane domain-containing protein [Liquorilactobacillus uvarum]|uniref:LiaF transmembrane domain-containing protein n=1 Tax=Liquorilactobacillus uvarum TaxID=303240 RepID=UPI002889302C|nr:hypothetical protein [Liquorilactobacillus uvarum]
MKKQRWFWGIFFLLSAGLLVAGQMGWISAQISFWSVIITLFLVAAFVQSVVHRTVPGMVFSIAFLCMLYAEPLGIKHLVPWTILGAAVLLSIGFSLLFHQGISFGKKKREYAFDKTSATNDDSHVHISGNMNSSIQYVQSQDFRQADVDAYASGIKIYFDNTRVEEDNAIININAAYSGVEFYVPKTWKLKKQVDSFLSGIEEKGRPNTEEGPTVILNGNLKLSGLVIHYI